MLPALSLRARLAAPAAAFGAVMRNPALRRVEAAFLGFSLAEWATWIAILVFAYGHGGAGQVGLVALIQLAPAAVVAPLAASFGDRYPRERALLVSYLLQAATMGVIAAALLGSAPVVVVYVMAAFTNCAITLTRPIQAAILPSLARTPAELTAANVIAGTIENLAILAGPAIAGVTLQAFGPGAVYAVSAAISVGSAALVLGLPRTARREPGLLLGTASRNGLRGALADAVAGFPMLAREEHPRSVVVLLGSASVLFGALDVFLVVLAIELLSMGQSGVGFLNAALGAGGIVGAAIAVLLVGRPRLAIPFGAGLLLWGAALAAVGLLPLPLVAVSLLAIAGMGRAVMDVAGRTLLQRVAPDALLSRVFGVLEGIDMATLAIGSILAPALIALAGVKGAFLVAGLALVAVTALNWRRLLRTDAAGVVLPRELAALMGVPFFAPLPGPALERLAAALIPVTGHVGETIITQGEAGDRFYIIVSGELGVSVDGQRVRTLGAGESFGEIALLRGVPRTATVAALTEVQLLALDRHHFLEAVTGQPASAAAAEVVIHGRLG